MQHDDDRRGSGDSLTDRLTLLLIGAGLGGILALLFAPKSGDELRSDIADATRKARERSREAAQQLGSRYGEYYEATRERASELYGSIMEKARPGISSEAALPGDEDFREPAGERYDEDNREL
jgi:gas vesicle protein